MREQLTDAQYRLLVEVGDIGSEVFAPHPSTVRALCKRGLIKTRLIGMRRWWVQPTAEGRAVRAGIAWTDANTDALAKRTAEAWRKEQP